MDTPSPFMSHSDSDDGPHPLLEPASPAYSNVTVRRAFIVWMYCGQVNKFKDVCNYYHQLEIMEEQLTIEQRAASRHHEVDLFSNPPPTSPFLETYFPKLYSSSAVDPYYVAKLESIKNEKCIFKLEGFSNISQSGVPASEILETSQTIRKYCQSHQIPLRRFLQDYKDYSHICQLPDTVNNVACYIKRKLILAELASIANPPTFKFLDEPINMDGRSIPGQMKEEVKEKVNETHKLRAILGLDKEVVEAEKTVEKKEVFVQKENVNEIVFTSADFFKSFSQQAQSTRANSFAPLPGANTIEDFVRLFDQNRLRTRSVEVEYPGKSNIVHSLSFTNPQEYNDFYAMMR